MCELLVGLPEVSVHDALGPGFDEPLGRNKPATAGIRRPFVQARLAGSSPTSITKRAPG